MLFKIHAVLVLLSILFIGHLSATEIANSINDFSLDGTQGENGWVSGYRNYSLDGGGDDYDPNEDFIAFDQNDHWRGEGWRLVPSNAPWTLLNSELAHPNGQNNGEEHWAIRRWESDRSGPLAFTWSLREQNDGGSGVGGSLHHNGVLVDSDSTSDTNGFSRTYFPKDIKPNIRKPIPIDAIKQIQQICYQKDDDLRWLIALLSDTGMRLGEAVGLLKSDIYLTNDIPYVNIRHHPWRSLKTIGSERKIPLVGGASLWAAKRIIVNNESQFAFPRYTNHSFCNANHASAALNKWIKEQLTDPYVIHGFRHSMRDRLRAVECPSDIVDRIGGWLTAGVGQTYGKGYPLGVLNRWMSKI